MSEVPTKLCAVCECRIPIGQGTVHSDAGFCVAALLAKVKALANLKTREMIDCVLGCAKHEDDLREEKARAFRLAALLRECFEGDCGDLGKELHDRIAAELNP